MDDARAYLPCVKIQRFVRKNEEGEQQKHLSDWSRRLRYKLFLKLKLLDEVNGFICFLKWISQTILILSNY